MPIIIDTNKHGIRRERNTEKEKQNNLKRRKHESNRRRNKDNSRSIERKTNS